MIGIARQRERASVRASSAHVFVEANRLRTLREALWRLRSPRWVLVFRIVANLVAACGAALFARVGFEYYERTHSLIGAIFFFEEMWVVAAYLVRRPALLVSQRSIDWLLAFGARSEA